MFPKKGFWQILAFDAVANKAREDSVLTKAFADHRHKHVKTMTGPKHCVKQSAEEYNRDCFKFDPLYK